MYYDNNGDPLCP